MLIRESILQAALAALNGAGKPSCTLERDRLIPLDSAKLPHLNLVDGPFHPTEPSEELDHTTSFDQPVVDRTMIFSVEVTTAGSPTVPASSAAAPLLAWCTKALGGSKLGGIVEEVQERKTYRALFQEDRPYLVHVVEFEVKYQTLRNDAERSQ